MLCHCSRAVAATARSVAWAKPWRRSRHQSQYWPVEPGGGRDPSISHLEQHPHPLEALLSFNSTLFDLALLLLFAFFMGSDRHLTLQNVVWVLPAYCCLHSNPWNISILYVEFKVIFCKGGLLEVTRLDYRSLLSVENESLACIVDHWLVAFGDC